MFFRVLAIIFASTSFLHAGAFSEVQVYVWGDVESVYDALNTVVKIINANGFKDNIEYIAVVVSALLSARWLVQEDYKRAGAEIAYVIGIMFFVYGTTTTVHIIDQRTYIAKGDTTSYEKVDNVPFLLAFTAHTSSIFTRYVVEQINTNTDTSLSSQTYQGMGFLKGLQAFKKQLIIPEEFSATDKNATIIKNYYLKCIMNYATDISPDAFASIINPNKKAQDYIDPDTLGIGSKKYDYNTTCKQYWDNKDVLTKFTNLSDTVNKRLGEETNIDLNNSDVKKDLLKISDPNNVLTSVEQVSKNLIAASMYEKTAAESGVGIAGVNTANAGSSTYSKMQMLQNGPAQFSWMSDMLPKAVHMLMIIIMLAYVPMGIIVAVMGMQKGMKILMNFFFGYISFGSIGIAFAIVQSVVNHYMSTGATKILAALGGNPVTASHIPTYVQYLSDMTGVAGVLGVASIPLVMGIMYKGEVAAAAGVAMGVSGAFKSLGAGGARHEMQDAMESQLAEQDKNKRMSKEDAYNRERLRRAGFSVPTNGTAIEAMAEVESGMDRANKANASANAMMSNGLNGANDLNIAGGMKSAHEEASKVGYGASAVTVTGGELNAVNLASTAGTFEGQVTGSKEANSGKAINQINAEHEANPEKYSSSEGIALAAGGAEAVKGIGNVLGEGEQAISDGVVDQNGALQFNQTAADKERAKKKDLENKRKQIQNDIKDANDTISDPDADSIIKDAAKTTKKKKEKDLALLNGKINDSSSKIEGLEKNNGGSNLMTASALSSAKDVAGMVQTGREINSTPDGFSNAVHSAKLKAIQDANSEMTTGEFGKDKDYRQVAIDNSEIAAKAVTDTNKRRTQLKKDGGTDKDGNPTEKWSADKIAEGQAIGSVQDEIKTQGAYNSLEKEKGTIKNKKNGDGEDSDTDAFRRAAMGAEFTGRKQENDMLGVGKKWAKETASKNDVKLMADEQKIAAVSSIGGIKKGAARIKALGGVDSAIAAEELEGKDEGTKESTHVKALQKKFGKNLDGKTSVPDNDTKHDDNKNNNAKHNSDSDSEHNKELRTKTGNIGNEMSVIGRDKSLSGEEKAKKIKALEAQQREIAKGIVEHHPESSPSEINSDTNKPTNTKKHTPETMSLRGMYQELEDSKLSSQIGQAGGIKNNIAKGVDYAQNAMYGEESKQQSTKAKIDTQGGVGAAVTSDVNEATLKAKQQQMGTTGNLREYLQSKAGGGHSPLEADKMAKAIMDGGRGAAEFMKQAVAGAGALALAQSMGKTASDVAGTEIYKSPEEYAKVQAQKSSAMAEVDKIRNEKSEDPAQTQKKLMAMRADNEDKALFDKQAIKTGIATRDANGNLIATTGQKFTDGMSALGAGDMPSTSQVIIGGERMNVDTDIDGNALVNRDSSENIKRGRDEKVGTMGYIEHALGKTGEVALYGLAGTAMVDGAARTLGMKDGVAIPLAKKGINQMASTFGFEEPFSSKVNESDNKGTNINGSQPTNGSESQQNKSVHEKTPRTTNYAGQPTENHPINQSESKGILSKFGEMFKSPKMEKLSEISRKAFSSVHSPKGVFLATAVTIGAGYEVLNGTDASASELPTPHVNSQEALKNAQQQHTKEKQLNPSKTSTSSFLANVGKYVSGGISLATPVVSEIFGTDMGDGTIKGANLSESKSVKLSPAQELFKKENPNAGEIPNFSQAQPTSDVKSTSNAQQVPTSTTDNIQQAINGSSSMPISTAVVSAIQGTSTPQGVSSVNIDANAIGQTIANSLSNIGSNIAPAHIQQAVSGSATNATTGTSGDNAISAITQGGGSMGGGHVGSMLAEGKAEASTAGAKATKISTEHASNDYMQGADVLDELKKFNESIVNDNKMKEG